tara:strand:+ start:13 stop:243 length:231 start_codon:yes stop_codon:yes gene_type:complete
MCNVVITLGVTVYYSIHRTRHEEKETGNEKVYTKELHNILQAMKGTPVFDRVGFDLPKQPRQAKYKTNNCLLKMDF